MAYERPTNPAALDKAQKLSLLKDYVAHYEAAAAADRSILNRKLPRNAFSELLNKLGGLLLEESIRLAAEPGPVRDFLEANPLPHAMDKLLPDKFRTFCLALNALKQWVAAEQGATDRFLLGGEARDLCRAAASICIVTGAPLGTDIELHHPVRDGRPPIPVSTPGHDILEAQCSTPTDDPMETALLRLKREGKRKSWVMLKRGCLDLLGKPEAPTSRATASGSRTFARKASAATGWSYAEILDWLHAKGY